MYESLSNRNISISRCVHARARDTYLFAIFLEYYDRPELPDEAFEDFLMMIIYAMPPAQVHRVFMF